MHYDNIMLFHAGNNIKQREFNEMWYAYSLFHLILYVCILKSIITMCFLKLFNPSGFTNLCYVGLSIKL